MNLNGNMLSDGANTFSQSARNQVATMNSANLQYDAFGRRTKNLQNTSLFDGANAVQELSGSACNTMPLGGAQGISRTRRFFYRPNLLSRNARKLQEIDQKAVRCSDRELYQERGSVLYDCRQKCDSESLQFQYRSTAFHEWQGKGFNINHLETADFSRSQ